MSTLPATGTAGAQPQSTCVVCGTENEHGLRIVFHTDEAGAITAEWRPSRQWEGFRGIIHGGIVTTVLDEAMSKSVAATGTQALTCELRVRLRRAVTASAAFHVRGWTVERKRRRISTEAVLTGPNGEEYAHAWAVFLVV